MSRCRHIYILFMWSIFHLHLHFYRHTSSFAYFLEYALLFLDGNVNNVNNFQITKVQPQGAASKFAWFFANFSLALLKVLLLKKACRKFLVAAEEDAIFPRFNPQLMLTLEDMTWKQNWSDVNTKISSHFI